MTSPYYYFLRECSTRVLNLLVINKILGVSTGGRVVSQPDIASGQTMGFQVRISRRTEYTRTEYTPVHPCAKVWRTDKQYFPL